ncbi:RNA-binding domain-containing protein [Polyplosphaeria fusca]|uniref:RNA-binding domain-containing protein n=1 Tax=Polyplosphaeria fusca TaxID=682080 RepID=A0A9P4R455_9PLEO|nr:RNA-binding domain-containing protein [Polyplosphaeria fusca]
MASMEYENEQRGYNGMFHQLLSLPFRLRAKDPPHNPLDEPRAYDRDRSRSPRGDRRDLDDSRARSASPNGRDNRGPPPVSRPPIDDEDEEAAANPGSNLFVTGIHPSLSEDEIIRLFEKYGVVEQCNIMRDPHTKESRGFGFVKMATGDQADAAKEGLQGEVHQGRTLSIEKARRAKPRNPTPGKYYGPPKRVFRGGRGGGRFGDRYDERYDDRRGGYGRRDDYGGGGYGRRDDYGGGSRGSRYGDREDRGYRRDRDDYGPRGVDRYASRDDRYSSRGGDDRRGGGYGGYYDRPAPPASGGSGGYGDAPPRQESHGGSRSYDDRGDTYH